jgi:hypothetical protein
LDSAGYGAFTITHAVSIIAPPGVYAGISVFSGTGIRINAGATDTVILRGLTTNNQGTGDGITFITGGTLHLEGCVVNGLNNGISFLAGAKLEVKESIIRGNQNGIIVEPASGTAEAVLDQVRLEENGGNALAAREGSAVTVRNSLASGNNIGFEAVSANAANVELDIENCEAFSNSTGIFAFSGSTGVATVRVSNSTVTHNDLGLNNAGGPALLLSRGNNTVEGNTTDTMGTIGSYSAK